MSAYRTSAAGLLRLATEGTLADRVAEHARRSGHGVGAAEHRSWARSLPVLAQDLADAELDRVEVLVEYQLPLTSRRIDAVLAGVDPRTGADSFVVIELKQWSYATAYEDSDTLVDVEHFMDAERNNIEVLICDEAHRIRETSVDRFTPKAKRANGRPQIDELIAAARVPVFLLDEHQVVKPGERGNVDIVAAHAKKLKLDVDVVSLHAQFPCGGSESYEQWVLSLLGLDGGEPSGWDGDGRFDLRLAESPAELEAFLAGRQAADETARMSAGFCWPWSDPRRDGTLVPDVRIGSWARPWNARSERSVGDAPGSAFWATDPAGFGR